jgi:hypothetical protein
MYQFIVDGQIIATADEAHWFESLKTQYPQGSIVYKDLTPQPQPVATGAQTL